MAKMHWILVALVAPLIWSVLNHLDKYLVSRYKRDIGVAGLAIYSSFFAIFVLPFIYLFDHQVLDVGGKEIIYLVISGIFYTLTILFYLYALERDDASHVVPFWFLVPMFGYLLGIAFLGEYIAGGKMAGALITLAGALILSLEFDEGVKVKGVTALLMIGSSLSLAFSDAIYKYAALDVSFWQSIFWSHAGFVVFGLILFLTPHYRRDFMKVIETSTTELTVLNVAGEIGQTVASIVNFYALLLAPISLVLLVNYTFQPLFVFAEGLFLSSFFPRISDEKISHRHIIQKLVAIVVMSIGVYLIVL
jgi:uncharacterized membrane protein